MLYFGDTSLPQNIELAYKYCKAAERQGDPCAHTLLPKIKASLQPRACIACATVEQTVGTYQKCAGCRMVRYCGAECQRAHWKATHTHECKQMMAAAEEERRGVFASMRPPPRR